MKSSSSPLILLGIGISIGLVGYYIFHRHSNQEYSSFRATQHSSGSSGTGGGHGHSGGGHGSHGHSGHPAQARGAAVGAKGGIGMTGGSSSHAHPHIANNHSITSHNAIHNVTHPAKHNDNITKTHDHHHNKDLKKPLDTKLNNVVGLNINADPLSSKELKDPKINKVRIFNDCAKGATRNKDGRCEFA